MIDGCGPFGSPPGHGIFIQMTGASVSVAACDTNLQNLDVAAVEASLGDEAALATRPHGQVDVGLVGAGLHRKPGERRVSGGTAACVFHHAPNVLAVSSVRYGITTEW